jgi:hypothetical protein
VRSLIVEKTNTRKKMVDAFSHAMRYPVTVLGLGGGARFTCNQHLCNQGQQASKYYEMPDRVTKKKPR